MRKRIAATLLGSAAACAVMLSPAMAGEAHRVDLANPHHEFVSGPPPETNVSPAENGFACFNRFLATDPRRPVFTVGRITDQTGKFSNEASAGGFEVTQGLTSEIYSAYGKFTPDFNVVERTDTEVPNFDIGVWKQQLLGDPNEEGVIDAKTGARVGRGLRQYRGGQILAADYYITGAITEVNYNIDSGGLQVSVQAIGGGKRVYSMSVAMDLRIVDARSLRVVKAVSERKIVRGYEIEAGIFNFLGRYLIDINGGKKAQEPLELGIRATAEEAVLKLVGAVMPAADGTNFGIACADYATDSYGNRSARMPDLVAAIGGPVSPPQSTPRAAEPLSSAAGGNAIDPGGASQAPNGGANN
jgi:curli biogenesis system outer membrane secretion channel CsgG